VTDYGADKWATENESRAEIVERYRRAWEHSDATITALDIDAPGHVPWWPRPDVKLFNVLVHVLTETNRHAGHADILREQLDGAVGTAPWDTALQERGTAFWESHRAKIEQAVSGRALPVCALLEQCCTHLPAEPASVVVF
jgi:hypothetical protein